MMIHGITIATLCILPPVLVAMLGACAVDLWLDVLERIEKRRAKSKSAEVA